MKKFLASRANFLISFPEIYKGVKQKEVEDSSETSNSLSENRKTILLEEDDISNPTKKSKLKLKCCKDN